MTTLKEYYGKLTRHDWFYMMSDDNRVFTKGKNATNQLLREAKELGDKARELYDAFHSYHFSGPLYGTAKALYPKEPKE